MSQTIQRFKQKRRRDWRDPFEWFTWYFTAVAASALASVVRLSEDAVTRLSEDGVTRVTD